MQNGPARGQPWHARSAVPRLAGISGPPSLALAGLTGLCFLGLRRPPHCLYLAEDRFALPSQRADVPGFVCLAGERTRPAPATC